MWVYQETKTNAAALVPTLPEDTAGESLDVYKRQRLFRSCAESRPEPVPYNIANRKIGSGPTAESPSRRRCV